MADEQHGAVIEEAVASTSFAGGNVNNIIIDEYIVDAEEHHTAEKSSQTQATLSANIPRETRLHEQIKNLKQVIRRAENKESQEIVARDIVSDEEFIKF